MSSRKNRTGALLLAVGGAAIVMACSTTGPSPDASTQVTPGMLAPEDGADLDMAGARLWAENCIRCHNVRTPASLGDRQWQIVMHHMRVRAHLTGKQQEAILEFLQAAN